MSFLKRGNIIGSVYVIQFSDGIIGYLVNEDNGDFHCFKDIVRASEFVKLERCHVA